MLRRYIISKNKLPAKVVVRLKFLLTTAKFYPFFGQLVGANVNITLLQVLNHLHKMTLVQPTGRLGNYHPVLHIGALVLHIIPGFTCSLRQLNWSQKQFNSFYRYYAICCRPLVYRTKMTPVRVVLMIGGCWVIPTVISFLPIMQGWNSIGIHDLVSCILNCIVKYSKIPHLKLKVNCLGNTQCHVWREIGINHFPTAGGSIIIWG